MKTNPRMFMLKIRKVPKKLCSWCLNHVGLCNASFLLGIGIGQAIHGNYTGLLLQIPFVVLWWLYNHMEVLCCDMQRIASKSLNNARESQRIAEDFKERYFALLKTINDVCMGQNESDNNKKTEKDILNKDLQLTPESEIKRLNKVIAEKNRCIEAFKKYDAERKEYYSSLEAKYKYMEDEFNRFVKAVDEDCNHTTAKQVSGLLTNFRQFSYGARFNKLQGQVVSARVNFSKLKDSFEKFISSESFILSFTNREEYDELLGNTRMKFDKLEKILEKKID